MTINQLFRKKPCLDIMECLLDAFGLDDFGDNKIFSRNDLYNLNTVDKLIKMKEKLGDYYLPCKSKIYLTNLNAKKSITILRQFIKVYNYILFSKEKYIKSEKIIIYQLIPMNKKTNENKIKNIGGCVISFD